MEKDQALIKNTFDRKAKDRSFKVRDLVLKWDVDRAKPRRHSKFDAIWSGPYMAMKCKKNNAFQLASLDGEELQIPINGIYLKRCF